MEKESSIKIKKSEITVKTIVIKRASEKPKKEKSWKVIRAPKRIIAHDAPSKKLIILSNLSFCIKYGLVLFYSYSTTKINISKHHENERL